ncbi:MAG: hypothetical protein ABMB14_24405 [Myxococcota bacterium]
MSRSLFAWVSVLATGCVFHVDDWKGNGPGDGLSASDPYVEPSYATPGETGLFVVYDSASSVDFREVIDVRTLGDVDVLEWTGDRDHLDLALEIGVEAHGDQILALDFDAGTILTSFVVE